MYARNSFGVGFMRGLNSVAEVFAPYPGGYEDSPIERMRSDWTTLREDVEKALGVAFAKISPGVSEQQLTESRRTSRPITRFVSGRWRAPLPPPTELEKIDQLIPCGAERLLQMAEKEQAYRIQMGEKEHARRIEDSRRGHEDFRRGQWLGWFLAAGALTAAAVVSLFHAPWQASVALVGIPVLGAVQALIQSRKDKGARRPARWF